uniref:Pre-mRNA splicing Prp18-interacting factor n=1 Tax=Tanacetum cinerariifolium TaxID=118510 RepID=A0A699I7T4_TANCI|nr:hypothetical protein [Tanacetum cinerariifolium]GEZ28268.1 hypothetical protein [Tanacetum cinerariifolium]
MSSFNQRECKGCGQPCDGFYCYLCPLNGRFCSFCDSRAGNSFAYDPNPNSFNDSQNLSYYPPQPQYQTYSCELCGNDAQYGYDCPPQVPEYLENSSNAITPDLPTKEPDNSLSMGDGHLSTILETQSDEVIKSSVKNLVPIPNSVETSPPDSELVSLKGDHTEETSSGSTTTHADNSLPEYDSFLFEIEPDQGELISVVMKDILG